MSRQTRPSDITKKRVVYQIPGMDGVRVRRDVEYAISDTDALTMDIYYPESSDSRALAPVAVIVAGYPDPGYQAALGCKFKEMGSTVSWAQLLAASGVAAIAYTNRRPEADLHSLIEYLRQNAVDLGIDGNRVGLWASSGNGPLALSLLFQEGADHLECAVFCYAITMDLEGSTGVASLSDQFKFANPCAGKSIDDLKRDIPLLMVRAGQDQFPHLNESMDRFVAAALARNLPVTLINYPEAPHAFDVLYDNENSREVIKQILGFMRFHLLRTTGGLS